MLLIFLFFPKFISAEGVINSSSFSLWSFLYSFSPSTWIAFLFSTAEQAEGLIHQIHSLEPNELM